MSSWLTILIKALNGGIVVVLFALVGEVSKPKRFAGIFGAAPTVALANLGVTAVVSGSKDCPSYALGMLGGTAAFLVYALTCPYLIQKFDARTGSFLSFGTWAAVAAPIYWLVLR